MCPLKRAGRNKMKVRELKSKGMRTRKTIFAAALAACMTLTFALTGCGEDANPVNGDDKRNEQGTMPSGNEDEKQGGYLFEINGVTLGVDMDMNELLSKLGDAKSVFEAESCAAQGKAYIYSYGSYEIETYPDGEKNRIAYIILKDDTVATQEGIDLSRTRADIIKAYGEAGEESDGRLTYEKGGMKLNFIFNGEDIASIEYVSGTVG